MYPDPDGFNMDKLSKTQENLNVLNNIPRFRAYYTSLPLNSVLDQFQEICPDSEHIMAQFCPGSTSKFFILNIIGARGLDG